jgi:hypothetical protein
MDHNLPLIRLKRRSPETARRIATDRDGELIRSIQEAK